MITILGLDPGKNNFAFSVVELRTNPTRYRIIEHGMIKSPVQSMNGLDSGYELKVFAAEIRRLKKKHKIDYAVGERFMTRGNGGPLIEIISYMLGAVGTIFGTECCWLSAAIWKNAFNKRYDLKEFYEELKPYGIPTHRIDAISIGLYGTTLLLGVPHFEFLTNIKQFKQRIIQTR